MDTDTNAKITIQMKPPNIMYDNKAIAIWDSEKCLQLAFSAFHKK